MDKRAFLVTLFLFIPAGLLQFCAVYRYTTPEKEDFTEIIQTEGAASVFYPGVEGLEGEALKQALHRAIRNHKRYRYQDLWEILTVLDGDPDQEGNVVLLYTQRSQPVPHRDRGTRFRYEEAGYTLIDSWNREHVWPKSHGFPNPSDTAYTDLHHIRPTDRSVNSAKNTRSFHYGEQVYFDNRGTIETRNKLGKASWTWEPPDEVKGDIARMLFYMAVRYEGPDYDLELVDSVMPRQTKEPLFGKLSTLLEWNEMDPVDDRERRRNDQIFTQYQGNRNPFIDHPDWALLIWPRNGSDR
ncbi:MAG: endonuclease [Lunatimonas sp.]|uniref:endonuclease I family protein n=1 Tax=Lunatimonas sp. TaxID=2060141 RepID=UPI00263A5EB2|nr:endonuclease [Lunatimonas sp.]MCC5937498.1 endonuclease [Lunatimonas sp.]